MTERNEAVDKAFGILNAERVKVDNFNDVLSKVRYAKKLGFKVFPSEYYDSRYEFRYPHGALCEHTFDSEGQAWVSIWENIKDYYYCDEEAVEAAKHIGFEVFNVEHDTYEFSCRNTVSGEEGGFFPTRVHAWNHIIATLYEQGAI